MRELNYVPYYQLSRTKQIERKNCRNCKFFIRVFEETDSIKIRGFCLFGMNQGDFSLYLSTTYAHECPAFLFDERNYEVTQKEEELHGKWSDLMFKIWDKRTREYKMIKPILEKFGLSEYKLHYPGLVNAIYKFFIEIHIKEFRELRKIQRKYSVSYRKYALWLSTIVNSLGKELLKERDGNEV